MEMLEEANREILMEKSQTDQPSREKSGYGLRVMAVVLLGLFGVYSCNAALYNAWLTAVQDNATYLNQLSLRFWLFAVLSCFAFGGTSVLLAMTIRRMNREYRRREEKNRHDSAVEQPRITDSSN